MCSDDDDNMICNDDAFIVVLSVCGRGPQEHCCARVNIDIHNTDCNMLQCDMLKWNMLQCDMLKWNMLHCDMVHCHMIKWNMLKCNMLHRNMLK